MIIDEHHIFENKGRTMKIVRVHDVEPLLDEITDVRNNTDNGWSESRLWRRVGSIPMVVVQQEMLKGNNLLNGSEDSKKWVQRWLRENSGFRIGNA